MRSRYFDNTGFSTVAMMSAPSSWRLSSAPLGDRREDALALQHLEQVAPLADREDHDRDVVVAHEADRRGVHHAQVLRKDLLVGQGLVALGGGVLLGVGGVDAVDAGAL